MQIPINLLKTKQRPLHEQIMMQLQELIITGRLRPSVRLPSTRELSVQLNVSRNTVMSAYNALIEQGYIFTHPAGGTYVASTIPEHAVAGFYEPQVRYARSSQKHVSHYTINSPGLYESTAQSSYLDYYNFTLEQTDYNLFPVKTWRRLLNKRIGQLRRAISHYGDPAGLIELRRAIAEYVVLSRGIVVSPEQVFITAGCQQGLSIVSHLLIRKDTPVIVEEPTYAGALFLFKSYGAKVVPVPVDEEGIDSTKLPSEGAQLAFVTPSHQSPMGITLSEKRRQELLDWCSRTGAYIVEVDFDGEFWYEGSPLPAIHAMDQSNSVIYLGTFSKLLGPGIRLGYILIPEHLVDTAKAIKALLDSGHSWIDQAVMASFIETGSYAYHLRMVRQRFIRRRNCMVAALRGYFGDVELSGLSGGTHLVWKVPEFMQPAHKLVEIFNKYRVRISSLNQFQVLTSNKQSRLEHLVFLGYSAVSVENIEKGIARMSEAVKRK